MIHPTDPRTNPAQFREKLLRIYGFEIHSFFDSMAILVVEFSREGYKIGKVFDKKSTVVK